MAVAMLLEPFFVDANILMYAEGGEHPYKEACARALARITEENLPASTSAEVLQEILHRYISLNQRGLGRLMVEDLATIVPNVFSGTKEDALRAARLSADYPGLPSRDLVHLAVMLRYDIPAILSTDTHFDNVPLVHRIDPADF